MPVLDIAARRPSSWSVIGDQVRLGAIWTGVRHGLFCLGCCWMLMALLFVGGLMSLAWVGAITLFVLFEKTMPWGDWMSRFGGVLLVFWGVINLIRMA